MYKVIRMYCKSGKATRTIATGLTLEAARAHCRDPETSSSTCTASSARRHTRVHGAWFDGFEAEA